MTATTLVWSDEIAKRVRTGDWADQTVPTTTKIEDALREAGDDFDWAWNEEGVCYYCAHCCLALEKLPAERWGHPIRVVDPPLWRGEDDPLTRKKCQWTVYKSLDAIPETAYQRIGMTRPIAEQNPE